MKWDIHLTLPISHSVAGIKLGNYCEYIFKKFKCKVNLRYYFHLEYKYDVFSNINKLSFIYCGAILLVEHNIYKIIIGNLVGGICHMFMKYEYKF